MLTLTAANADIASTVPAVLAAASDAAIAVYQSYTAAFATYIITAATPAAVTSTVASASFSTSAKKEQNDKVDKVVDAPFFFTVLLEFNARDDSISCIACNMQPLPMSVLPEDR